MIGFPHKKWNPGVNIDLHNGIFMTPAGIPDPAVLKGMHIGALVLAAPFYGMGSDNSNDQKVLADGMPVVSRGHEVKYSVVPHINVLPPPPSHINILGALLILGSSSKCQLAASKVKCHDGPLAISGLKYVGINTACADPCAMPTSIIVNWGTVNVGYTLGDVLAAAFLIAFEALQTFAEDKLFAKLMGTSLMNKLLRKLFRPVLGAILKAGGRKLAIKLAKEIAKEIVSGVFKAIYGESLGGRGGKLVEPIFSNKEVGAWVTDPLGTASGKAADGIASWVDEQSESVPSGSAGKP